MVKNEITRAWITPSVTKTSLTAADSSLIILLIVKLQRPCAGYSAFMAAKFARPRIRSFDCGYSRTKSSLKTSPTELKSFERINDQNRFTTSTEDKVDPPEKRMNDERQEQSTAQEQ